MDKRKGNKIVPEKKIVVKCTKWKEGAEPHLTLYNKQISADRIGLVYGI